MHKKTKFFAILLIVFAAIFIIYNYVMTAGARDLESEKSAFSVTSIAIFEEFSIDAAKAKLKYVNKAVEISGKISNVNDNVITLDGKVSCQLLVSDKVEADSTVTIKGRVIGYDDLLEELKLDQCLIVK